MKKKPQQSPDDSNDDIGRDLERLDNLLRRGLDEISDIEIDEITKGMSVDDILLQAGNDSTVPVERSEYSQAKKISSLVFEEDIQFIIENTLEDVNKIPVESIDNLITIPSGKKIAVFPINPKKGDKFEALLRVYDQEYQNRAGVVVKSDGSQLMFYAARNGKIILFKDRIFLLSENRDGSCNVTITSDMMEARIDCFPAMGTGSRLTVSSVVLKLEHNKVVKGLDIAAIETAITAVNSSGMASQNSIAARGQPAQNGKNSTITFHFPSEVPDIGFKILPDGRIDYKKQAPLKMVTAGDLLATVSLPEPGIEGFTVTGEVLPAKEGSFDDVLEGENVRRGETGDCFYAQCSGLISFHEMILSVYPHYQVDGDVDMHSGNINFNGSVTVYGNVKSGFEVKAAGDIFIAGSIEAATIEAGRDVRINGAVVGGNGTTVKAGRNIFAGHVQNAQLEAQGDVTIVRSAMHSFIYSTGKVFLHDNNGSIVGGSVNAMRGIEAVSIGSHMGTPTEVVVGSDFMIKRRKNEIQQIIRFYEANQAKIDMVLRPLLNVVKKGIPLGSEKKRRLTTIIDKRHEIIKQLRILRHRHDGLAEINPAAVDATVVISKTLFQDVTVKIGDLFLRSSEELQGVKYRLSADKRTIEMVSTTAPRKTVLRLSK